MLLVWKVLVFDLVFGLFLVGLWNGVFLLGVFLSLVKKLCLEWCLWWFDDCGWLVDNDLSDCDEFGWFSWGMLIFKMVEFLLLFLICLVVGIVIMGVVVFWVWLVCLVFFMMFVLLFFFCLRVVGMDFGWLVWKIVGR